MCALQYFFIRYQFCSGSSWWTSMGQYHRFDWTQKDIFCGVMFGNNTICIYNAMGFTRFVQTFIVTNCKSEEWLILSCCITLNSRVEI